MLNEVEKWKGKETSWAWSREANPICPKREEKSRENQRFGHIGVKGEKSVPWKGGFVGIGEDGCLYMPKLKQKKR